MHACCLAKFLESLIDHYKSPPCFGGHGPQMDPEKYHTDEAFNIPLVDMFMSVEKPSITLADYCERLIVIPLLLNNDEIRRLMKQRQASCIKCGKSQQPSNATKEKKGETTKSLLKPDCATSSSTNEKDDISPPCDIQEPLIVHQTTSPTSYFPLIGSTSSTSTSCLSQSKKTVDYTCTTSSCSNKCTITSTQTSTNKDLENKPTSIAKFGCNKTTKQCCFDCSNQTCFMCGCCNTKTSPVFIDGLIACLYVVRLLICQRVALTDCNVNRLIITALFITGKMIHDNAHILIGVDDKKGEFDIVAQIGGISHQELVQLEIAFLMLEGFNLYVNQDILVEFGEYIYKFMENAGEEIPSCCLPLDRRTLTEKPTTKNTM
jgi:hypothetical protein